MLLSFVANESIAEGTAVAVLDAPLGRIRAISPLNFADARSVKPNFFPDLILLFSVESLGGTTFS